MKTKYVHIGLPKNLSTTLQRDFFSKHPDIYHLGVGVGSNIDYINPRIASVCENHFQYSKNFAYNIQKENIIDAFNSEFKNFEKDTTKKACGISLELLSFTFTPDQIEIEEKAKRVFEAFGKNTKIIIIIRQQFNLLESLYKEAIKIGYYGTFTEYLDYIYLSRDRNFIYDFQYDYLVKVYSKYFGMKNIEVLTIEDFRDTKGDLIYYNNECLLTNKLSHILGLSKFNFKLGHYNKPLNMNELYKMMKLNYEEHHGIGNQAYSTATNFHRLKDYFKHELGIEVKDEVLYKDARIKNKHIELSKVKDNDKEIQFDYPKHIKDFLENLFFKSNKHLEGLLNIKLPEAYFK